MNFYGVAMTKFTGRCESRRALRCRKSSMKHKFLSRMSLLRPLGTTSVNVQSLMVVLDIWRY
jgi:hypothetical protein